MPEFVQWTHLTFGRNTPLTCVILFISLTSSNHMTRTIPVPSRIVPRLLGLNIRQGNLRVCEATRIGLVRSWHLLLYSSIYLIIYLRRL